MSAQQPDPGPFAPKTVPYKLGGVRLDRAVHELYALPWAKARQAIQTGKVFVQGQVVLAIDHTVNRGDGLAIVQNAPRPSTAKRLAFEEERPLHFERQKQDRRQRAVGDVVGAGGGRLARR